MQRKRQGRELTPTQKHWQAWLASDVLAKVQAGEWTMNSHWLDKIKVPDGTLGHVRRAMLVASDGA